MDSVREGKWIASAGKWIASATGWCRPERPRLLTGATVTVAASDRVLRPEPATTGRTADERLTGLRFESVVADDEGARHGTGTDPVGDRRRGRFA